MFRAICNVFILCVLCIFIVSCKSGNKKGVVEEMFTPSKFDEDDFSEAMEKHFKEPVDVEAWKKKNIHGVTESLQYIYQANSFEPLWITETGGTDFADALLKDLEILEEEGLNPEKYNVALLKESIDKFKKAETITVEAAIVLDTTCTRSYLSASRDLLLGRIRPATVDSLWFHKNDTTWNADQVLVSVLLSGEQYPSLDSFRSKIISYSLLLKAKKHYKALVADSNFITAKRLINHDKKALDSLFTFIVKTELPFPVGGNDDSSAQGRSLILNSFQRHYGLNPTGKFDDRTMQYLRRSPDSVLDILDANLERLRWMQQELHKEHVLVDVPLMELFLNRNGNEIMKMNVIVGKTVRQTPSLDGNMSNVVFNPPWGVPPTILKKDVIPGMERKGKAYLREKDLKVYDRKGNLVDASRVNASNYKQYVFRQDPGDDNALGYIKFFLVNDHDIYLHDTPHRELFDTYDRAQSSGCVRVQMPKELAEYVLAEINDLDYDRLVIDSMIRTQQTKHQLLKNKIPVHIVYLTAFGNEKTLPVRFARDIYKKDAKLIAALK